MPLIALVVLFWQRRRVAALLRSVRTEWEARPRSVSGAQNPFATAASAAERLAARAWRAVDTPQNAARAERLVDRIRAAAARADRKAQAPTTA